MVKTYESERDRGRAIADEAQSFLDRATSQGRSLTGDERATVKKLIEASRDAHDSAKIAQQIDEMQSPHGGKSSSPRSSLFDPHALAEFSKAAAAGEIVSIGQTKATLLSPGAGLVGDYRDGTVTAVREPFRVSRLFPAEQVEGPAVSYRRITTASAAAATVAEGALKPESSIVAEQVEAPVRKVAVYLPVAEEVIEDGGQSFVNDVVADLVGDLVRTENQQLLNGTGVAPNLRGVLQTTGLLTRARGTDTSLDAVLKGITQLRTTGYLDPTDIVMNPTNFEGIRLSKSTTNDYILSDPFATGQPTLQGASLHLTTDIPAGTALVMNAPELARVYVRTGIKVEWGTVGDQFQRNIKSVIAEERLAFAVRRPAAGVSVTGLV